MPETIEQALRGNVAVESLTRIDVGLCNYRHDSETPYIVTVWYDVPADRPIGIHGCSTGNGATIDDALTEALTDKAARLEQCARLSAPMAEAA